MKIYLADTDSNTWTNAYHTMKTFNDLDPALEQYAIRNRPLRILTSYHYFKTYDYDTMVKTHFDGFKPDIFADSGAFSAVTQGAELNIDDYAKWIIRWREYFTIYANLDVIGDPLVRGNGKGTLVETEHPDSQANQPAVNYGDLLRIGRELIVAIGSDPTTDGMQDTPRRFADYWREFIEYDPGNIYTTFESVTTDQMVVVTGIRVWSVCEHHLLPFWCDVSIGYIATDKVLGLSKFGRIAHMAAHRPQLQERLVHEIADEIQSVTGADDIAVIAKGEHLCMTMRGIKSEAMMVSSVTRGMFRSSDSARAEFLSLVK